MIEQKRIVVRDQAYQLQSLPGRKAFEVFHTAVRAFGPGWFKTEGLASLTDFGRRLIALSQAPEEDVRALFAAFMPKTQIVHKRTMKNPAGDGHIQQDLLVQVDDSEWDNFFTGERSLDGFDLMLAHLEHNFGAAFLARKPSLTDSNGGQESPAASDQSQSPKESTG